MRKKAGASVSFKCVRAPLGNQEAQQKQQCALCPSAIGRLRPSPARPLSITTGPKRVLGRLSHPSAPCRAQVAAPRRRHHPARPSRTFKRRQPAARPRILHTRRHDQAERARCRVMVRAACEGRLWPQQVHQTGVKACRRRAVVGGARHALRGAECSGEPEATWVTKWWPLPILSRAELWWGCA